ncbi:hypothetical protein [Marinilactibacillus psychrotolerans]|uniref:hypothetical protein n=1 Tax=Marinilactibacillus psychrotolerans TaxID=191770 RepID=UPI0039AECC02
MEMMNLQGLEIYSNYRGFSEWQVRLNLFLNNPNNHSIKIYDKIEELNTIIGDEKVWQKLKVNKF